MSSINDPHAMGLILFQTIEELQQCVTLTLSIGEMNGTFTSGTWRPPQYFPLHKTS